MAKQFPQLPQNTSPVIADKVPTRQTSSNTDKYVTIDDLMMGGLARSLPQGTLINGKIVTSVATNNLTVAIKTLAGNDPSPSDPIYCRIGNSIRPITTATSKTLNAGTNWFNAGSSELATFEIDYFTYLVWNTTPATDRVDIAFARIPYGRTYADFSGTSTSERYLAFSGSDTPASTDEVEVIGRLNAILGASASYNWSIPATSVIVNRPIFETRLLGYAPQYTASGSMTYTSVTTNQAKYSVKHQAFKVWHHSSGTTGGTASAALQVSLPFTCASEFSANSATPGGCRVTDTSSVGGMMFVGSTGAFMACRKYDSSNFGLGAARQVTFEVEAYL